jgi:histidyl-tRNA synthetase
MNKQNSKKLSTEPYKGTRDFYPEDMAIENYIFSTMRRIAESFGYVEYGASILEPAELYRAKSGEEIVNEQTYTFTDRGGREVTLRPEMTPTTARLVAKRKRELAFPLRWYSIPNLFRYERPQRGRLREHWQLNVDLFGLEGVEADAEIIEIACRIMEAFGIKNEDFEIRLNSRELRNLLLLDKLQLTEEEAARVAKINDKKDKISQSEYEKNLENIIGDKSKELLEIKTIEDFEKIAKGQRGKKAVNYFKQLMSVLEERNLGTVNFNPALTRGFDYYTGMVFEVFDKNPKNNRSLFGGGRYDELMEIFGVEKVPAVGFGMGDVTIRDVLDTYDLIPPKVRRSKVDLYICTLGDEHFSSARTLAQQLRKRGVNVAVDYTAKKIPEQIKKADKNNIAFILCIGEEEARTQTYRIKNLKTGKERVTSEPEIAAIIDNWRNY